MEMNVCNANTNWLRGEQDGTKDPGKMTKTGRIRIKQGRSAKLGRGHGDQARARARAPNLFLIKNNI